MEAATPPLTRWRKLTEELKEYAVISVYLYVCFAAILLYKASVLKGYGIDYAHFGLAAAKALILGKFMLIGEAIQMGKRHRRMPLIYAVLYKSVVFLVLLVVLTAVEEVVVGAIHGRTVAQTVAEVANGRWEEWAATCFLLWLILLPYFGVQQLNDVMGHGQLRRMLFDKRKAVPGGSGSA
jgi:hypothetical protein